MIEVKKFSAAWCGPCKTLGPIMDKIMDNNTDITYTKIDIDDDKTNNDGKVIASYGVRSVPTVIIEKDGEIVDKFVGMKSASEIQELLMKYNNN